MESDSKRAGTRYLFYGIGLFTISLFFPMIVENIWLDIFVRIREATVTGDSGHLIIAAAFSSILRTALNWLILLSVSFILVFFERIYNWSVYITLFLSIVSFVVINITLAGLYLFSWEPVTTITSLIFLFYFMKIGRYDNYHFLQLAIVSVQVFFAFQWLNILPIFSMYYFGQSDIPVSIKITGDYVDSTYMLNFIGFSFFFLFIFSAVVTTVLFRSYAENMRIVRENYQKERELVQMKSKVIENRIYQEINLLAHDLKTPLVTIRGLNSLLALARDISKLELYSQRIEGAIEKMNQMVSSFLYASSRQLVKPEELLNYIRAQIPMEDDKLKIDICFDEQLPRIFVNKVRVVRAIINILENAIIVPYRHPYKEISIEARRKEEGLKITIADNGIGIAPSEMSRIWEVGYSTGKTSGLGLPFARQIIEENNGTINIESEVNKGTLATVIFPAIKESEPSKADRRGEHEGS